MKEYICLFLNEDLGPLAWLHSESATCMVDSFVSNIRKALITADNVLLQGTKKILHLSLTSLDKIPTPTHNQT
jgi:hypothetical protein